MYNLEIGLLSTICERAQHTQTCEKTHRQKSADRLAFVDECIIPDVPSTTLTPQPLVSKQSIASKQEIATGYAIFTGSVQQMQLWGGSNDCTSDGHLKRNSYETTGNGGEMGNIRKHCKKICTAVTATGTLGFFFLLVHFYFYRPSCDEHKSCEQHAPSSVFMQALSPVLSCVSSSSSFTIDEQNRKLKSTGKRKTQRWRKTTPLTM